MMRTIHVVAIAAFCAACSSCSTSAADAGDDASAEDAGLSSGESTTFNVGGGSMAINEEGTKLADSLFDFDPTIDPTTTAAQNAAAIGANIQMNLGSSCGTVSVMGADVTVSFGAPPGCTLTNGNVVSGAVSLVVSQSGGTTTIALALTSVVCNGEPLSGTASFATTNGTTFAVTTNLTSSDKTDSAQLTVTGRAGSYTVSGTSTLKENGLSSALTFAGLTVALGQCYATAGALTVSSGPVSETLTFDANTPTTGQVTAQIGKRTTTLTLPPYGSCPTARTPPDAGRALGREGGP